MSQFFWSHDTRAQVGVVHRSSTTSNRCLGNSFRCLSVHIVALRGASLTHWVMSSVDIFKLTLRNSGPKIIASPGPSAPDFRVRSQPHNGLASAPIAWRSLSRRIPLIHKHFQNETCLENSSSRRGSTFIQPVVKATVRDGYRSSVVELFKTTAFCRARLLKWSSSKMCPTHRTTPCSSMYTTLPSRKSFVRGKGTMKPNPFATAFIGVLQWLALMWQKTSVIIGIGQKISFGTDSQEPRCSYPFEWKLQSELAEAYAKKYRVAGPKDGVESLNLKIRCWSSIVDQHPELQLRLADVHSKSIGFALVLKRMLGGLRKENMIIHKLREVMRKRVCLNNAIRNRHLLVSTHPGSCGLQMQLEMAYMRRGNNEMCNSWMEGIGR